ncbi:hypothetical protein KI387_008733, partial [Taxus chinensis]
DWPFKKIISAHFAAPISANQSDFKTTFAIQDVLGNEKFNLGLYCSYKTDQLYLAKDSRYKFYVVDTTALERVQETRDVFLYDALFNLSTWEENSAVLVDAVDVLLAEIDIYELALCEKLDERMGDLKSELESFQGEENEVKVTTLSKGYIDPFIQ